MEKKRENIVIDGVQCEKNMNIFNRENENDSKKDDDDGSQI